MRVQRAGVLAAALLLPGVMLGPVWRLSGLGAGEDDVLYYFPVRTLFHDFAREAQWPWFNPWTGLGRPYLADPQTAVFYPATWLFAALPPLVAYPLSLWLHYSLALWGMYRLLRFQKLDQRAALFGGLAFAFCGFLLAHRAHFAMQHAAAWMPIVLWRLHRYADAGGPRRLAAAAVAIALQCFSGHVQIAALTALGSLVWLLASGDVGARRIHRWLLSGLVAAGLFAVQLLPTLLYTRLCTRMQRGYLDFVENSWNPLSLVGWLLPMLFGQRTPNFFDQGYWGPSHQVEQFCYPGVLVLVLAALACRSGWRRDSTRRAWAVLLVFSFLLALGLYGPICPILYWLPGASLFRVPARAMLLCNLAAAALAAGVVHELGSALSPKRARLRAAAIRWTARPLRTAAILVLTPLLTVAAVSLILPSELRSSAWHALRPWSPAVWVPLIGIALSFGVLGLVVRRWQRPALLWLLSPLLALDLGVIGWTIDVPADVRDAAGLLNPPDREQWLEHVRDRGGRLWVVTGRSGGKPGEYTDPLGKGVANTNILAQVESLTDYGPLHPLPFERRFGFKPWGETERAADLLTNADWMQHCNLAWVLLCEPHWPAPPGGELVATTRDGYRLCQPPAARGLAYLDDATQPGVVYVVEHAPYRLTIRVDTGSPSDGSRNSRTAASVPRVVVSRLALPGWSAEVNDQPAPIEAADDLLMAVRVPAGETSTIELAYTPPGLRDGAIVSTASALALGLAALQPIRRRRKTGRRRRQQDRTDAR